MRKSGKAGIFLFIVTLLLVLSFTNTAFCSDLILNDLKSKPVNLSALTGKPAILFFWTTWCPYCRAELKVLNKMYPQMEEEGLAIFAIDVGEAGYKVERFLKDNPLLNINILLDPEGKAAEKYGLNGVPTYIFINKDGKVVSLEHSLPADYKNLLLK